MSLKRLCRYVANLEVISRLQKPRARCLCRVGNTLIGLVFARINQVGCCMFGNPSWHLEDHESVFRQHNTKRQMTETDKYLFTMMPIHVVGNIIRFCVGQEAGGVHWRSVSTV